MASERSRLSEHRVGVAGKLPHRQRRLGSCGARVGVGSAPKGLRSGYEVTRLKKRALGSRDTISLARLSLGTVRWVATRAQFYGRTLVDRDEAAFVELVQRHRGDDGAVECQDLDFVKRITSLATPFSPSVILEPGGSAMTR